MMDCKQIDELLVEYLYQEMDPSQVERFEAHLQTCPRCTQELSAYERTRAVMQDLPEVEPPVRVVDFLSKEAARTVEPQSVSLWERLREGLRLMVLHPAMTAAVTLVLVLGVSFYIYQRSTPPVDRAEPDMPLTTEIDRPRPAGSRLVVPADPAQRSTVTAETQRERPPSGEALGAQAGGANGKALVEDGVRRRAAKSRQVTRRDALDEANYTPGMRPTTIAKTPAAPDEEKRLSREQNGYGGKAANAASEDEGSLNKKGHRPVKESGIRGKHSTAQLAKAEARPEPTLAPNAAPMATVGRPPSSDKDQPRKLAAQAPRAKYRAHASDGTGAGGDRMNSDDLDSLIASGKGGGKRKLGKLAAQHQEQGRVQQARKPVPGPGRGAGLGQQQIAQQASSASYWIAQGDKSAAAGRCSDAMGFYNRAVEVQPTMMKSVAAKARNCAAVLAHAGEGSLLKAQKTYPRLAGILAVQLEQTRRARQATESKSGASGERVQQQQRAARKAAAPAKTKAAPAVDAK
jgi:hypothetical protein